ncbi:SDR family oxidoreductase [Pseudoalteromonas sp. T1lg22]|uniref:SDR family oxidoreductase n=1 Tax=Pseudoalteromonas sp. T1lg22 TaxID=2077096 RepID=UPI000CF699B9|nr:SDR family oxidoreductase [Pseudoalteromonas sp. T1lg22]
MQTILGASGQIGTELAKVLYQEHTHALRLVSRSPSKINPTDELLSADLLDAQQTHDAIAGSSIVYFTAGLPIDSNIWVQQWPIMMANVIKACATHSAKLVYFDNTYMYEQSNVPQTEDSPFKPYGAKGRVRAQITTMLLEAMQKGEVKAMICRAPEFYGPGKTQSITNATVLDKLRANQRALVFLRDDTLRTLIYTPDASRAMALLGNTEDAYNQTWHLPCDDNRLTYKEFIATAARVLGKPCHYKVLKGWQHGLVSLFNKQLRETKELLPRYTTDNIFVSDKFKTRFPDFKVTPYEQGIRTTLAQG